MSDLFALFARYYGATSEAIFRDDLANKSYVIELRDQDAIVGFSTIAVIEFSHAGAKNLAIFSGDTIIDREHWGEQELARGFCRLAGRLSVEHPSTPLFWFLISKGHRTYRYLHAFARDYYPRPDALTPPDMQARMDTLATSRFGDAYLPEQGIVRFDPPRGFLLSPWTEVRASLVNRPDVRFFLERNPGFRQGDELVCIAELSRANLRSIAARAFHEGQREFRAVPTH